MCLASLSSSFVGCWWLLFRCLPPLVERLLGLTSLKVCDVNCASCKKAGEVGHQFIDQINWWELPSAAKCGRIRNPSRNQFKSRASGRVLYHLSKPQDNRCEACQSLKLTFPKSNCLALQANICTKCKNRRSLDGKGWWLRWGSLKPKSIRWLSSDEADPMKQYGLVEGVLHRTFFHR